MGRSTWSHSRTVKPQNNAVKLNRNVRNRTFRHMRPAKIQIAQSNLCLRLSAWGNKPYLKCAQRRFWSDCAESLLDAHVRGLIFWRCGWTEDLPPPFPAATPESNRTSMRRSMGRGLPVGNVIMYSSHKRLKISWEFNMVSTIASPVVFRLLICDIWRHCFSCVNLKIALI